MMIHNKLKMIIINNHWWAFFVICLMCFFFVGCGNNDSTTEALKEITDVPKLKGKLVYHNYTTYDAEDSKMYLYDFQTKELKYISENWNIRNVMNAHFSPDGKQIVFMGIGNETNTWDIFLYDISGDQSPVNLTPNEGTRDEDPKFSPDGKRIAFKQNWKIVEMNLETNQVTVLSPDDYSMPYYNAQGTKLVCSKNDGPTSSIAVIDIITKTITTLYDEPNVQDYYPINADATSFYYSVGYSPDNRIDQVYRGYWNGVPSVSLSFNKTDGDYSDAYPINNNWIALSSTCPASIGGYDLFVANVVSGKIFSMTDYHPDINTPKNELGACVFIEE